MSGTTTRVPETQRMKSIEPRKEGEGEGVGVDGPPSPSPPEAEEEEGGLHRFWGQRKAGRQIQRGEGCVKVGMGNSMA